MRYYIFAFIATFSGFNSFAAEPVVPGSVLEGAKKLSSEEVSALMRPGAAVETYSPTTGSVRQWENSPGGRFTASRHGGAQNARSTGAGSWKFSEDGKQYCVEIEWRTAKNAPDNTESWCRAVYQYDGHYYLAPDNLKSNLNNKYSMVRIR